MTNSKKLTLNLTVAAMLTALSVVIGFVCKLYLTFGDTIRITFENLPVILAGMAFGPIAGAAVGAASDIVSCLFAGYAPNPLITVGAASIGLCAGLLSRFVIKKRGWTSLLLIVLLPHVVGSMLIKSLGMHILWGYALPLLLPRIPIYIGISLAESYIIYIMLKNKKLAALFGRGQ